MKTTFWYNTNEKLPEQCGTYLTFVGPTLADEGGIGTSYFAGTNTGWRESVATHSHRAAVVYWCDANPWEWYEDRRESKNTPALAAAWDEVQEAVKRYELVKALTNGYEHS